MAVAQQLPFDLASSQDDIDFKKQLAQALLQQSMQMPQGQMVSGHYIAPGLGGALLNALQGYKARDLREQARSDQANLGQQYHQRLQQGLEDYVKPNVPGQTLSDGQAGALLNNDQNPGPLKEPGYDPHKAAAMAVGSGIPELKQIGMEDFKAMAAALRKSAEPEMFNHQAQPAVDPTTGRLTYLLTGTRGSPKVVPGYAPPAENIVVGDRVVDKNAPGSVRADYRETFGEPYKIGPDWFQKDSRGKVLKLDNAPSINNNIDTYGNKEALQQTGKVLEGARGGMISAVQSIGTAGRIRQLLQDPAVQTGFGANAATGVYALGNKLGFNGPEAVSKTQALTSELAKGVLSNAAALKPLSDSDIKFLKDVEGGTADLNRDNLDHLAGLSMAAAHNDLMNNTEQFNSAKTVKGAEELSKLYPAPAIGKYQLDPNQFEDLGNNRVRFKSPLLQGGSNPGNNSPGAPMSLQDYIRLHSQPAR